MHGVILDAESLGKGDVDLGPITGTLDSWDIHPFTEAQDTASRIAGADVVLSNKIKLDADILAQADSLKLISIMATGTNNVDLDAARQQQVTVCNAVGYATPSVVQHTFAMLLSLATQIDRYRQAVAAGAWQEAKVFCLLDFPILELAGKTLGIVGQGTLGSGVGKVAEALGMNVLFSQKIGVPDQTPGRLAFSEVLSAADVLSLHCPLTPETTCLINHDTLAQMKPGALLINTARGGLIDSPALIDALASGSLAGAAIDVLDTEPPSADEPLLAFQHERLLITPHNAWGSLESRQRLVEQMRSNILNFIAGSPGNLVG